MTAALTVSVVVPTRDRPESLARCLESLRAQSGSPELIVVDDGSLESAAVRAAAGAARVIRLDGQGPAAARNAGVGAATGEVICFIDDDCEAAPDWTDQLATASAGAGVAAGVTVPTAGAGSFARASQQIADFLLEASFDPADGTAGFAPSCNLAVRRSLALQLPFDERFPAAAGEDREWCERAAAAGARPRLAPRAIVVHHQRSSPRSFADRQLAYGRGAVRYRRLRKGGSAATPGGARFYPRLMASGFAQGARVGALVTIAQLLTAAGAASELLAPRGGRAGGR